MALKRFARKRSDKIGLINELREILMNGVSSIKNVGSSDEGLYLRYFLSLGNMAYKSGDADIFEHYLRSLNEVVTAEPEGVDYTGLVWRVRGFGFRSIRDFDLDMFGVVLKTMAKSVSSTRDMSEIDDLLESLKDLALRSADAGFEGGVLDVVDVFRLLGVHFVDEGLSVSSMSLKNHIVGLVHYLGAVGDETLKGRVITLVEDVLTPSETIRAHVENVAVDSPP